MHGQQRGGTLCDDLCQGEERRPGGLLRLWVPAGHRGAVQAAAAPRRPSARRRPAAERGVCLGLHAHGALGRGGEAYSRQLPTDTTVNVFFSRYCRLANDSILLFYENVFETLRSGYGKFFNKRHLKGPAAQVHRQQLQPFASLGCWSTTAPVCSPDEERRLCERQMQYADDYAIIDPIESPMQVSRWPSATENSTPIT